MDVFTVIIIIEWIIILTLIIIKWHHRSKDRLKMLTAIKVLMTKKKLAEAHTSVQVQGDTMLLKKAYFITEFIDTSPKMMWAFDPQQVVRIGRDRENEIQIQNIAVSRTHGQIFEFEGNIYITNTSNQNSIEVKPAGLSSTYYVYAGQWAILSHKDVITLGAERIRIHIVYGADVYRYR